MRYKETKKAFPAESFPINRGDSGMDLRDYFAAKALQGNLSTIATNKWSDEKHVERAYEIADLMLKQREL